MRHTLGLHVVAGLRFFELFDIGCRDLAKLDVLTRGRGKRGTFTRSSPSFSATGVYV
jgi:hypothetical protein